MKKKRWKVKQETSPIIHVVCDCKNCDWETGDYRKALSQARAHVHKTGHAVSCDIGRFVDFYPKAPR